MLEFNGLRVDQTTRVEENAVREGGETEQYAEEPHVGGINRRRQQCTLHVYGDLSKGQQALARAWWCMRAVAEVQPNPRRGAKRPRSHGESLDRRVR
jgi:hypothetical protein